MFNWKNVEKEKQNGLFNKVSETFGIERETLQEVFSYRENEGCNWVHVDVEKLCTCANSQEEDTVKKLQAILEGSGEDTQEIRPMAMSLASDEEPQAEYKPPYAFSPKDNEQILLNSGAISLTQPDFELPGRTA